MRLQLTFGALLIIAGLTSAAEAAVTSKEQTIKNREHEYEALHAATADKEALEAIRELHRQLDNDEDGAIEPEETGGFIRQHESEGAVKGQQRSSTDFHRGDVEVTVSELWKSWRRSHAANWTAEQVSTWVAVSVELPQYAPVFARRGVNGSDLPLVAASPQYLSKALGIANPIHRSKLALKAMDVVLFGPPRENGYVKDIVLTSLLVIAVTGLFYAYRVNKRSQEHLRKMMNDMDSLAKAEQTLQDLQEQLQQKDSKIESLSSAENNSSTDLPNSSGEVSRLKEELELLRSELHRAEVELEDKCWVAPPVLQHWLQLTYELESATYNAKKKAAESQLELAKDMCERLKRKRSSLVGAFVSTHGHGIDDVDRSILEAKSALLELTKDLTERSQRWRQIEMLCGCGITANPGIPALQSLVRHVGVGLRAQQIKSQARLSSSMSTDDLAQDGEDARSVAASSSYLTASRPPSLLSSTLINRASRGGSVGLKGRESSKESSSSSADDLLVTGTPPPVPKASSASPMLAASAKAKRTRMMVKSYSQDAGGTMSRAHNLVTPSASEGQLGGESGSNPNPVSSSGISFSASSSKQQLEVVIDPAAPEAPGQDDGSIAEELEESCPESESGSLTSLDKKTKKKKSFFSNFRRKKEKKDLM